MFSISFNFDEKAQVINNIKVQRLPSKYDSINLPIIEVETNRLIFSPKALDLMAANCGDRIIISYFQKDNETIFPVVGKAETFVSPKAGTKLTRSNSISFKGEQRDVLCTYGSLFVLEELKTGMFKLNPIKDLDLIQETTIN